MDWDYIMATFGDAIESTHASREQVLDALSRLETQLGLDWIAASNAAISNSSALGRMVEFAKCLRVADAVSGGGLRKKLCTSYASEECQGAIAEALTAERLLMSGAVVQYEPLLPGMAKRPDLVANWGAERAAFEIVFPSLSAHDATENQQMSTIASQCSELLTSGTLNIYSTESTISADTASSVIAAVRRLSSDIAHIHQVLICDRVYVAYDPGLNELPVVAPNGLAEESDAHAFPVTDSAYREVKRKLGIMTPMSVMTLIAGQFSPGSRLGRARLIVRMHRPAIDPRALGKAEQECDQLPSGCPGVVVIDMSRTSVSLKPDAWARDLRDSFAPGLYPKMSAVWLRSGSPEVGGAWAEWLVLNPYAVTMLPTRFAHRLIPGAVPFDLG